MNPYAEDRHGDRASAAKRPALKPGWQELSGARWPTAWGSSPGRVSAAVGVAAMAFGLCYVLLVGPTRPSGLQTAPGDPGPPRRSDSATAPRDRSTVRGPAIRALLRRASLLAADGPADGKMPTMGRLSSPFLRERTHPVLERPRPHRGIDIAAPWGAPIHARRAGVVVSVEVSPDYGQVVRIRHGAGFETRYAHCSRVLVHEGQSVPRGHPIALVGDTGLSTGPHLHYEVILDGRHVDPLAVSW